MAKSLIMERYGNLPLTFEANQGQTDRRVKFLSRGDGYNLFLTSSEAVLILLEPAKGTPSTKPTQSKQFPQSETHSRVLRMKLANANLSPKVEGLEELSGRTNYFIGNDPKKWRTNVPIYAKVKYHAVYPGVDLVYYGKQQELEHDFIVAPGSDPRVITLDLEGAEEMYIGAEGDLIMRDYEGEARLQNPVVYQEIAGVRQVLAAHYILKGKHQVGFEVAAHDMTKPLVIDPVLLYSTYFGVGSNSKNRGQGIAVDSAGNAYVVGLTQTTGFPTTPGALRTTYGGSIDAFVTKLSADGSSLVYSTFLGGSGQDQGFGIGVDSTGNAYVTGGTNSFDFPTTPGAFQSAYVSNTADAFITKLNPDGSSLVYSTYLAGGFNETITGLGIALDSTGNVYVAGLTNSVNLPITPGAFQTTAGGSSDGFVIKLSADGSSLVYSTYVGGSGQDFGEGIAVDSTGNVFVTGTTSSANFPTTPGAFQTTYGEGFIDAFAAKLTADGSSLIYSTYIGGSGQEEGLAIAVDSGGNAYMTGDTNSPDFPTTLGAYQNIYGGALDAFVTKISVNGSSLVYSTYLGGSGQDSGHGIAVDSTGNVFVTGYADVGFSTTPGAIQSTYGGGLDAFVTKLDADGSSLLYSTYLGGSGSDIGTGIVLGSPGNIYVTGYSLSSNFPITPGAFQTTGSFSPFVAKIGNGPGHLFLHGSGALANPSTLFLNNSAPTVAAASYKDSAGINFSGGDPWKEIGTWPAAPALTSGALSSLSDLHVWLGLKNSDDQGTRFDLRADILKNGTVVASGETDCIQSVTRNPDLAKEVIVSFGAISPSTFNGTSDVLSVKVLTRIGTNGSGGFCGGHSNAVGLRLYFDAVGRPARFDASF